MIHLFFGNTRFILLFIRLFLIYRHTGCKVTKKVADSTLFFKKNAVSVKNHIQKD